MSAAFVGAARASATRSPGTATLLASGGSTSFARPAQLGAEGVIGAIQGGGQPGFARSGMSNFFASPRSARMTGYARRCVESLIPPDMNPAAIDEPMATYSLNSFFASGSPGSFAKFADGLTIGALGTLRSAHAASERLRTGINWINSARRDTRVSWGVGWWPSYIVSQ